MRSRSKPARRVKRRKTRVVTTGVDVQRDRVIMGDATVTHDRIVHRDALEQAVAFVRSLGIVGDPAPTLIMRTAAVFAAYLAPLYDIREGLLRLAVEHAFDCGDGSARAVVARAKAFEAFVVGPAKKARAR